jgi:hypothetical protein
MDILDSTQRSIAPTVLTVEQLADQYYHCTARALHVRLAIRPGTLPPCVRIPGVRRVMFLRADVDAWFAAHRVLHVPDEPTATEKPRRRGRPTKAESLAKSGRRPA